MSIDAMSTAPFSIGTSSSNVPGAAQSMDMSLDDLIAARRTAESSTSTPRNNNRRRSLKSTTSSANNASAKKKNLEKSLSTNRAKRNAKTAARRGLANNGDKSKPDPKSIEREAYRLQRSGKNAVASRTRSFGQPRRSSRLRTANNSNSNNTNRQGNRNNNNKSAVDRKIKAKNMRGKKQNQSSNNSNRTLQPPSKKAFNAAVKAMNSAGFTAPKGMKMVISFAPTESKNNNNNNNSNNNRRGQNGNSNRGRRN